MNSAGCCSIKPNWKIPSTHKDAESNIFGSIKHEPRSNQRSLSVPTYLLASVKASIVFESGDLDFATPHAGSPLISCLQERKFVFHATT